MYIHIFILAMHSFAAMLGYNAIFNWKTKTHTVGRSLTVILLFFLNLMFTIYRLQEFINLYLK